MSEAVKSLRDSCQCYHIPMVTQIDSLDLQEVSSEKTHSNHGMRAARRQLTTSMLINRVIQLE